MWGAAGIGVPGGHGRMRWQEALFPQRHSPRSPKPHFSRPGLGVRWGLGRGRLRPVSGVSVPRRGRAQPSARPASAHQPTAHGRVEAPRGSRSHRVPRVPNTQAWDGLCRGVHAEPSRGHAHWPPSLPPGVTTASPSLCHPSCAGPAPREQADHGWPSLCFSSVPNNQLNYQITSHL